MNKTIKVAGLSAVMLASAGAFAVLGTPSAASAFSEGCNQNPTSADFTAAYAAGSVTTAHVAYIGELPLCIGATQTFSLSAYATEGATWETSGKQTMAGFATVTLGGNKTEADLTVKLPKGECYFQTDLYANGKKYDGVDGPLPHYPDTEITEDYIDSRVGGAKVCEGGNGGGTPTPTPTPAPTPSVLGVTELPKTGSGLAGVVALSAGLVGAIAGYRWAARRVR